MVSKCWSSMTVSKLSSLIWPVGQVLLLWVGSQSMHITFLNHLWIMIDPQPYFYWALPHYTECALSGFSHLSAWWCQHPVASGTYLMRLRKLIFGMTTRLVITSTTSIHIRLLRSGGIVSTIVRMSVTSSLVPLSTYEGELRTTLSTA